MKKSLPFHGGQLRQIAEHFGIPPSQLLDFSANINPEGPPSAVLAKLRSSLADLSTLTSYPDSDETTLRESLARYAAVSPENIAVANGFVPLIETALRSLPIRRCLVPVPAFVEYRRTLARCQIDIVPQILTPESDFSYNIGRMLAEAHDAILLANPQNPSGVLCPREVLLNLVAAAAHRNIYMLLDEAFIDYAPENSLAREVDRLPNLIVFRSVTKFFGMPGLRVAYAIAYRDTVTLVNRNLPPWPITTLASYAVSAALEDEIHADRTNRLNRDRRARLAKELEALSLQPHPSQANFVLFRVPSSVDSVAFWERMICDHRIVLRHCGTYESLAEGYFRAAVRTDPENARLVEAITQALVSSAARSPFAPFQGS
jgi:threonine-phosphate decarboxylase